MTMIRISVERLRRLCRNDQITVLESADSELRKIEELVQEGLYDWTRWPKTRRRVRDRRNRIDQVRRELFAA